MELSVEKSLLFKELNLTQGVVERKTTIPILSNLLLEAADSSLRISATDLELGVSCGCSAKIKKPGSGTIPAKRLFEIVRSLPDKDVKLKLLENHWMQVTCDRSSFKLVGMAKDNYPTLPALPDSLVSLPAGVLSTMIKRTIFSISSEESRYTLNGALLILKPDNVAMVATDGHRLALIERDLEVAGLKNELRILIPKKAMAELQRLLAEADENSQVGLSKDDSHLYFSMGHRVLISRMLTGQFPNYEAVLPRENKLVIEIDKDLLSTAVSRVALLADQRSRAVRLKLADGQMEISSSSGEFGEAHEELEVGYSGEPMQVGFNYEYLLDFLNVVDDGGKVRLELKDEQSAGQMRSGEEKTFRYRYVVMPMRV
jgi:DNA polymerase-3 subunit beta